MIARFVVAAVVGVAVATSYAASSSPAGVAPARPIELDRNTVLMLIRTTLVAVQQANQTGNYSVLYGLSAPGFQQANSPEKLAQVFSGLRKKGFDLSGVVVLDPQLSTLPVLYPNGVMRMAGFFPSVPMQVYFDLQFIGVQGQWRLLAIGVDVGPPNASAPAVEAPRAAPPTTATPTAAPASSVGPAESPTPTPTPTPVQKSTPAVDVGKPRPKPTESKRKSTIASPRS